MAHSPAESPRLHPVYTRTAVCLVALGAILASAWPGSPLRTSTPATAPRADLRLDPNTATWWQLERLPGIGNSLARAIVAERERRAVQWPGQPAFAGPESLLRVPGLGPKKLTPILAYLRFPAAAEPAVTGSAPVDTTPPRP